VHPLPPPYISTRRRDGRQQDRIRTTATMAMGGDDDD
jgi:hypothetical protein